MNEITTTRANALIDPTLHVWHAEVALYLFLGGIVAGVMVLTGLALLRRPEAQRSRALALTPWHAPVLLTAGLLFLWLDLENRWNVLRFYLTFRPASPMSWGAWILLAIYPISILAAWASTPALLRDAVLARFPRLRAPADWAVRRVRSLAVWSVLAGIALGVYTGVLLGAMAARPLWNSAILGPLFLVSGLSTGAALMLLARLSEPERRLLGRIDTGLIVVEIILIALWLLGLAAGGAAARDAVRLFFGGPFTAAFWTLVVALGLLTPLLAGVIEHRRGAVPGRAAAIFVLIGGLALRWIIVLAGQHAGYVAELTLR